MPTPEQMKLLVLADEKPLQALHASAGRLRRVERAPTLFLGIYVPSPVSDEYTVLLNAGAPYDRRFEALRAMVIHHVEAHDRTSVYVLQGEAECAACRQPRRRSPAELREHSLRRSRSY